METENDSSDELEIVYPTLSRELAPSRACATDDTVPLTGNSKILSKVKVLYKKEIDNITDNLLNLTEIRTWHLCLIIPLISL